MFKFILDFIIFNLFGNQSVCLQRHLVCLHFCLESFKSMKIHGKIGFADFQEDDIQLPGFYTNIPPSEFETSAPH